MRTLAALLFLLVPVLGVWVFAAAPRMNLWLPPNASSFGGEVDHLFRVLLWITGAAFVITEGLLAWFLWRASRGEAGKAPAVHDHRALELGWTAVPAAVLAWIAFAQMATWKEIKFVARFPTGAISAERPFAEVIAAQFEWRFVYPGRDGVLGTLDDLETPYELVVPLDTDVVCRLESRDVIHSFFVPAFRLKQDILPGRALPIWFRATEPGSYDLVCAELCGWGHYKMAGRVRVLPRAQYDAWLAALEEHWLDNGKADAQ